MRVGVNGAVGQMGRAVCAAVTADADLTLVAAVDRHGAGEEINDVVVADQLQAFADAECDVVVDFTVAESARTTLPWLGAHGIHAVVGTTGFTDDDVALFETTFGVADGPNCLIAPNFAISAVLMMRFAEMAAPWFDTAEVIELHHMRKIDAPSGTAVKTIERMAAARDTDFVDDPTEIEIYPGARGGAGPRNIRAHSVRMEGMVAHQEVILGAEGQTLTIRQDSYDRSSFMPGVVLACKQIHARPGLVLSLDSYLD
ncbi:MAG: 4-hydroxy-tetrahydrodipicolinate reductase [Ilumatobacter sp.]|jgi:4-hydroxy-tetrahydrodipicolinate reductase|uniref:4-hydroxy-tetrahydrodipicolinate reductase n=1 Tax=Ilumatobacter sp. TaxID=1967498 RepID=UPI001DE82895|nr:4-hydroxy-tetrahydrodipicolinate reductase [Ilumatobacter sp.]MBT5277528.1 4-hydroxy-tetrahydrodipicolinate reductase [Ilumatobacter sp.]MBT5553950.1 4-hydroxy-tetrahydrodipicolinate reductase [Ilumatobacter sp.]MBT5866761.1 4-hydroxy-tetrahydrodipicolinate reductase [Ilumatobacter sp.]MBT7428782.1 4-hydroxy-tetrahydrodipicolinate reductase [Ilumatobacter sp.]